MSDSYSKLYDILRGASPEHKFFKLSQDEALSRIFKNLHGTPPNRAGLRLTNEGKKLMRMVFDGREITLTHFTNKVMLFFEKKIAKPYYYSEITKSAVIFDPELIFALRMCDGDIEYTMSQYGFMIDGEKNYKGV